MACMPAMRRRTFRNHLSFPESMANMRMGLRPMLLPHGREILPEHPDMCPAERRLGVCDAHMETQKSRSFFTLLWQYASALSRAVPRRGERPSPHQETEVQASARNATRSRSNMTQNRCSAEILPSDASGIRRVKPSSDGRGGGGQSLVPYRSLRTLCNFQGTVPVKRLVVMAQQPVPTLKDIRHLLPFFVILR